MLSAARNSDVVKLCLPVNIASSAPSSEVERVLVENVEEVKREEWNVAPAVTWTVLYSVKVTVSS